MRATLVLGAVALSLCPSRVRAEPIGVAVTPLRDSGLPAAEVDRLEKILIGALDEIGLRVVNAKANRLISPRRGSAEARFAEDPSARALALGGELKVPLALAVDAATLGEGFVLYLQGVDVVRGKPIASTAASVAAGVAVGAPPALRAADEETLGSALTRVLLPERYLGNLVVNIDVPGAQLLVDGAAAAGGVSLPISCSTHTLRVTHPAYRDFLRFVTIEYGRPTVVDVALSKYPVDEGELRARKSARKTAPAVGALAWYQRWWVVTLGAAVLFGLSAGITAAVLRETTVDRRIVCCGP